MNNSNIILDDIVEPIDISFVALRTPVKLHILDISVQKDTFNFDDTPEEEF